MSNFRHTGWEDTGCGLLVIIVVALALAGVWLLIGANPPQPPNPYP